MTEIEELRERLRLANEALSAIAADSKETVAAWIADGCDAGDAISHVTETGERAAAAMAAIADEVKPTISIIMIGIMSLYHCYLNVPMAEALRRYEKDSGSPYDPNHEHLETMLATDHVEAYHLFVPEAYSAPTGTHPTTDTKDQA